MKTRGNQTRATGFIGVLIMFAASSCADARNFRAECEASLSPSNIRVQPGIAAYITNSSLSTQQLTGMNTLPGARESTVGLTVAEFSSSIEFEQNGLHQRETGEHCVRLHFRVKLSYNPITVYVGREFKPGTCAFREILRHEEKHVAAYERKLRDAAILVEREMRSYFGNVIYYGDPAELRANVRTDVEKYWMPLAQRQLADVEQSQRAIDTEAEYAQYRDACNGELRRIPAASR